MLTNKNERIRAVNELAWKVYEDKHEYYLTINEIAKYRKINACEVRRLYKEAEQILRLGDDYWLYGLSERARKALKQCGYESFDQIRADLLDRRFDIEDLKGIGHKVAFEIRSWGLKPR